MLPGGASRTFVVAMIGIGSSALLFAQVGAPALRAGGGADTVRLDGVLSEPAWNAAEMADAFAQTDPSEGAPPTFRTVVRVLAGRNAIVIGIVCDDADPAGIVSFNVRRDAPSVRKITFASCWGRSRTADRALCLP